MIILSIPKTRRQERRFLVRSFHDRRTERGNEKTRVTKFAIEESLEGTDRTVSATK